MTVPRTVADVLSDHVTLEVECIDRMYLNVYQPRLQYPAGAGGVLRGHRGARFASSALMDPISKAFVASIHRFAADSGVPLVDFAKGQRKDDVAHEYLAGFEAGAEGVLFVGRAQEKTTRVPDREAPQPGDRGGLPVDRAGHRDGQPLLLLLRGRRLRSVLPEVLLLLPVQRQAVRQRQ